MLYRKTDIQYDIEQVKWEYDNLFLHRNTPDWYESEGGGGTQLCLQSYNNDTDPYTNGCGSMSRFPDRTEYKYDTLNPIFKNTVFENIIKGHFRARFMKMIMHTTYSVHADKAPRLHLAIDTHDDAYFFWPKHQKFEKFVHIPADGYVYWIDTTEKHTFVNAGPDRTHLVMVE